MRSVRLLAKSSFYTLPDASKRWSLADSLNSNDSKPPPPVLPDSTLQRLAHLACLKIPSQAEFTTDFGPFYRFLHQLDQIEIPLTDEEPFDQIVDLETLQARNFEKDAIPAETLLSQSAFASGRYISLSKNYYS